MGQPRFFHRRLYRTNRALWIFHRRPLGIRLLDTPGSPVEPWPPRRMRTALSHGPGCGSSSSSTTAADESHPQVRMILTHGSGCGRSSSSPTAVDVPHPHPWMILNRRSSASASADDPHPQPWVFLKCGKPADADGYHPVSRSREALAVKRFSVKKNLFYFL